jgi:hypothetical protein
MANSVEENRKVKIKKFKIFTNLHPTVSLREAKHGGVRLSAERKI